VVIHQCGRANKLRDSLAHLTDYRKTLSKSLQQNYFIKEWITDEDLFWIYQHAAFAISRSGANAVLELSLAPLPAILIPLPGTYQDEQTANAKLMQQQNGALIIPQEHLSAGTLVDAVGHMRANYRQMRRSLVRQANAVDACAKLYQLLLAVGA
jgi:UDP-N-acetylglucosamine:LPS N-acetylglucosamine transferase